MLVKLNNYIKLDVFTLLVFSLIVSVYTFYTLAPFFIIPILIISYYKLLVQKDFTVILILMLLSRCIMGFFIPNNAVSFNLLNAICNYIPITIFMGGKIQHFKTINIKQLSSFKFTLLYVIVLFLLCLPHLNYAITEVSKEIIPISLFLLIALFIKNINLDLNLLLRFFRYSFIALLIVYSLPSFAENSLHLFHNPIIFKKGIKVIALFINGHIPRNSGFVFDFRIQAQLACMYFLLLYYTGKTKNYFDLIILIIVAITTFSRGPIIILVLIMLGVYGFQKITKTKIAVAGLSFIVAIGAFAFALQNEKTAKYLASFNPMNKKNAISQRAGFSNYAIKKFKEWPLGRGIGELSSKNANNKIDFGYEDKEKTKRLFYYKVGDAYWALTLGEKGIIGFLLFFLSSLEIFFYRKNLISLFFLLGLYINLIGTDIPKQGFYYFFIVMLYYLLSSKPTSLSHKTVYKK